MMMHETKKKGAADAMKTKTIRGLHLPMLGTPAALYSKDELPLLWYNACGFSQPLALTPATGATMCADPNAALVTATAVMSAAQQATGWISSMLQSRKFDKYAGNLVGINLTICQLAEANLIIRHGIFEVSERLSKAEAMAAELKLTIIRVMTQLEHGVQNQNISREQLMDLIRTLRDSLSDKFNCANTSTGP